MIFWINIMRVIPFLLLGAAGVAMGVSALMRNANARAVTVTRTLEPVKGLGANPAPIQTPTPAPAPVQQPQSFAALPPRSTGISRAGNVILPSEPQGIGAGGRVLNWLDAFLTPSAPQKPANQPTAASEPINPREFDTLGHPSKNGFTFSAGSKRHLATVHPDLRAYVERLLAVSDEDFAVVSGIRTMAKARENFAAGTSKLDPDKGQYSRHMFGYAVDLVPLPIAWPSQKNDPAGWKKKHAQYTRLAQKGKQVAREMGLPMRYGFDFESFYDPGHYELQKSAYPDDISRIR